MGEVFSLIEEYTVGPKVIIINLNSKYMIKVLIFLNIYYIYIIFNKINCLKFSYQLHFFFHSKHIFPELVLFWAYSSH